MADIYEIRILMARETLDPFADGVAAVCIRLPYYLKEQVEALRAHLVKLEVNSATLDAILTDIEQNAAVANEVGTMIATLIGHAEPRKVGTLDTKPGAMQ